jgi:flavodoxin
MKVEIVFDSQTGRTEAAAEEMAGIARAAGHECAVRSVQDADPAVVSAADVICIGSWCQGLYVVFQHATKDTMDFVDKLEDLDGKPAAVFCTYKLTAGGMLPKMADRLEQRGADVTGFFKSRGPFAAEGFGDWIRSLG